MQMCCLWHVMSLPTGAVAIGFDGPLNYIKLQHCTDLINHLSTRQTGVRRDHLGTRQTGVRRDTQSSSDKKVVSGNGVSVT